MSSDGIQNPVLDLACELIRRASVTPHDAGCQQLLGDRLRQMDFVVESLSYGEVSNLWAVRGTDGPLMVFAGHTDVVPAGPLDAWSSPPFEPTLCDGYLYGRGAADMKSSLAAMIVATEQFIADHPGHKGRIGYLITSDEEGDAVNGTREVMQHLARRNLALDYCVVGEPSSSAQLGDTIRVGRRGSVNAHLTVIGSQGHVAYPDLATNPVHAFGPVLMELTQTHWDDGNDNFPPTGLQISNVQAGTGATNVIPGVLSADFNLRFNNEHTSQSLQRQIIEILDRRLTGDGITYQLKWALSGEPFITPAGKLRSAVTQAISQVLGIVTEASTAGGTSDGRFIAPSGAQVVEFGPINATIHKVDERVAVADLQPLAEVYQEILIALLT
ncbi:MAG: succinyl-diaminopimelate desuccinylase [Gammaproteobacteria bacterium]|nr:succinyl-diaminopimelate desuccinylase [Gammaproteobacteria bacterium]